MSPPMPTTRRWPQTLLLTALSLLIAAATIMLACGPVAQPAPDDGDTLAAVPQVEGGIDTPPMPTATPVPPQPTVADLPARGIDAGNDTPTPEIMAATDTPTPEPVPATDTPTPEPATPTDTPMPEVLAKADVPVPATPEEVAPQETENTESPEPTATPTPTPRPTVCLTRPDGPDICVPAPDWGAEPTPKYPTLGEHYSRLAVEAEEAAASQAGGVSGQSEVEVPTEYVEILLANKASTDAVVAWLSENRVPTIPNWRQGDKGYVVSVGDDNIFALIPTSLLDPLSRQSGFAGIINGCRRSLC